MSEWEQARAGNGARSGTRQVLPDGHHRPTVDRLPPHSLEAEQGVLGCVLLDFDGKQKCLEQVASLVRSAEWFFDLRHRLVFAGLLGLRAQGVLPDLVSLGQWLKDRGDLEEAGGYLFLSGLSDTTPSTENLDYYIGIVREKFVLRGLIRFCTEAVGRLYEHEGALDGEMARLIQGVGELDLVRHDPRVGPKRVKRAVDFQEEYFSEWFGGHDGEPPGLLLPSGSFKKFPFKLRRQETTWFLGDKGNGKSTLLSEIALHCAGQGERVFVASFETRPAVTLKIAGAQLLGESRLPDNEWGHLQAAQALGFLNERFFVYSVVGIGSWRELLSDIRFSAREWGASIVVVDSVMRLGIADDDLAQQGQAACAFANLAMEENVHVILVNHLNKSDRNTKSRSRGSQQWIDNAHNVVSVERNEKKHAKVAELRDLVDTGLITAGEFDGRLYEMGQEWGEKGHWWDANFVLHDQRYPGSRTNASRRLFYTRKGLQYADRPGQEGVRYLEKFKETVRRGDLETLRGKEPDAAREAVTTEEAHVVQTPELGLGGNLTEGNEGNEGEPEDEKTDEGGQGVCGEGGDALSGEGQGETQDGISPGDGASSAGADETQPKPDGA